MPKPSEPTERDRELAARHCLHHARGDEDCTCADLERDFAQARAEEREAILTKVQAMAIMLHDEDLKELANWIEARGKEGEGDAKPMHP